MNNTKTMWNPLFTFAKRMLPSTSRYFLHSSSDSVSHLRYDFASSSSLENSSRVLPISLRNFLGDAGLSRKGFCSESFEKTKSRCWNCDAAPKTAPFLFCESCRSVQPFDDSVDYFQIFGLQKKYEIDVGSLEGKYKDWQKKLHPDLVHSKSQKERDYAAEQSGRVIEAYRTLTKPLSRAMYIMRLDGKQVNEEETITDPELLTEIMELREEVEEAADSQALNQIRSQIQEKLKHWSDSFAKAFQSRNYEEAATCIRRMTYYERAKEEIVKKL